MICEILEEDFRKLNLKGYKCNKGSYEEVNLNNVLDENINYWIEQGYESDLEDLKYPVTIAIHTGYDNPKFDNCYFDKFMDAYSGIKTYELGMGIKHIYSTRDYYEAREDYWRVRKNETKVIYRVHLEPREFVLKHKTVVSKVIEKGKHWIEDNYDLIDGEWVLKNKTEVVNNKYSTSYKPYVEK